MTTPTTETATKTEETTGKGVHAVMKNATGDILTVTGKTRTELNKLLQEISGYEVLHVYKGKELNIKEKVSYSFN